MNILQIVSSSRTSGAEKHVLLLSQGLLRRGHRVTAVCPPDDWLTRRLADSGVHTVGMRMRGGAGVRAVFAVRALARQHEIQVIHTHLTRAAYLGYFAGLLARVPVVSSMHVLNPDFFMRRMTNRQHRYVAVSNHVRDAMIAAGTPARKVITVYNGTEFADNDHVFPAVPLSVREELDLPDDSELVGLFGRVREEKGHPLLVRAASAVIQRRSNAYFVFVGHASEEVRDALRTLSREEGVADRIRFAGEREDIPRLMMAMDVITAPSLTESFGMVIAEAMAMGKAVVGTRAGGIPEVIDDQITGLLVERTPEAVAEALCVLLEDPEKRAAMGAAGRERSRLLFSSQAMAENIEGVYEQMIVPRPRI